MALAGRSDLLAGVRGGPSTVDRSFAAGVLYAYAQKRRGLLSDAIVAHAVTNALIAMQVLFAGHWSLW